MGLREINSDAHADARVTTGRAAGPNRVRIFALWTGHGETAVPIPACYTDRGAGGKRGLLELLSYIVLQ